METQKRSVSTFYTLLDDKLAHYALLSLGCLAVLIYVWKAVFHFNAHLRRLNTFSNSDQKYFLIPNTTLARIKNHLLYAPLFHTRHNREFQLSRAINMGTLPSRLHGLVIIGILSMNITLCLVTTPYGKSEATVSKIILNRTGTMATVNLIPLVLMAGRNNPLVGLLGVPFDTWNLIHRWLGRIVVLEAVAHALADVIPRVQKSGWSYLGARFEVSLFMLSGLVACCAFVGLMVHSVSPIRHAFYETFLHLHICLVILGLAMLWVHLKAKEADALKYLVAAITLWAFERATRLIILIYRNISTKHTTADVEALPGDAVRVSLRLARPWRVKPGQHIYLYIPSIGWWSSHPFSVAWGASGEITEKIPHDVSRETKTISLLIRRRTGFTDSLFKRVSNSPDSRVRLSAFVEGPYGGTHCLDTYGTILLFAGGVGITHHLPFVRYLVQSYAERTTAVRRITLVWIIQSPEHLEWIRPWMTEILGMDRRRDILRIKLFITRPRNTKEIVSPSATVQMFPGRPSVDLLLGMEVDSQIGALGVMVCGSGGLSDAVRRACRRRTGSTSVDYIEESFSW